MTASESLLRIPTGVRFECTGCGNCCYSWPVPVTFDDKRRITGLAGEQSEQYFRSMNTQPQGPPYTHVLEKRADGRCLFLTEEKRCELHEKYGHEAKPSMCQLFPYTFTPCPDGVYAYLSFASSGVLFNSGKLLSEQKALLEQQLELFRQLIPYVPDWTAAQIVDGTALAWERFKQLEEQLISLFVPSDSAVQKLDKRLVEAVRILSSSRPSSSLNKKHLPDVRPKTVDQLLLKHALQFYLPENVFEETSRDWPIRTIAQSLVKPPDRLAISRGNSNITFSQIYDHSLSKLDPASDELLSRFVYCRLFARLYFGPGFQNLSLLCGFNHLMLLIVLVRLELKCRRILGQSTDLYAVAEIVRTMERRLTMTSFSVGTLGMLEMLLTEPVRMERLFSLVS